MQIMDDKKIADAGCYLYYVEDSLERVVYTLKEAKWVFFEKGSLQPFENAAYYTAKHKKERLNKSIMLEYCEKLAILKSGNISLNHCEAFSYEMFWTSDLKGSKGNGPTSLMRK
jgi:hypothetical protein